MCCKEAEGILKNYIPQPWFMNVLLRPLARQRVATVIVCGSVLGLVVAWTAQLIPVAPLSDEPRRVGNLVVGGPQARRVQKARRGIC